ncbi:ABC transporter permease [Motilibacter aurantiacus]|uniref:ABC transporter permease n=1 Tax=Motilibacter aurantiacus TaxID=2714955 RepID=UPI00140C7033|nr:ABC transporter permease [Motilibacter aurantiacus]NHC43802.1 ABC transporter permease [Motilibacter aurantiacus]
MNLHHVLALSRSEALLVWRNRAVLLTATALPLALGGLMALQGLPEDGALGGWASVITLQLEFVLLFAVYQTATSTLVARRQDRQLSRLRTSDASDGEILAGLLAPVVLLGLLLVAALLAVTFAIQVPLPVAPALLVAAAVTAAALCVAAAVLTSAYTRTAESAQWVTMPFYVVFLGGAFWVLTVDPDDLQVWHRLVPGGATAELVQRAMTGAGSLADAVPAVVGTCLLAYLAAWAARRAFRWDART